MFFPSIQILTTDFLYALKMSLFYFFFIHSCNEILTTPDYMNRYSTTNI